jgi:hypothetical protein
VAALRIGTAGTYSVVATLNGNSSLTKSQAVTSNGGTYNVTANIIYSTLNSNSWAAIREVSDAGLASNYWNVGDTKAITINGTAGSLSLSSLSINVFIIGINHNSTREGSNRIHFMMGKIGSVQAGLVDSQYGSNGSSTAFRMNTTHVNTGGWNNSYMRKTILDSDGSPTNPAASSLMSCLPSDLRAVMKSCTKYSDNTGGGSNTASYVTSTTDYLFLLSEFEVQGARTYANSAEQTYQSQYAYFAAGNSKVFYRHSSTASTAFWWGRSVYAGNTYRFCAVGTGGAAYGNSAGDSLAVAPGFCV